MTSHCANPECAIPLRYLRDGRIFQFEVRPAPATPSSNVSAKTGTRRLSHFWLCGPCASTLTLVFDVLQGIVVRPRKLA